MKSTSVAVTAAAAAATVLAGVSMAQPHGHHGHHHQRAKRELVTEWETVWETVTLLVDESTTETIYPTLTSTGAPGEFFQPPSGTSTPEPQPAPTVVETPAAAPAPPPTTSTTTTSSSTPPPPPPPPAPTTTTTTTTPKPAPPPAPTTTTANVVPAVESSPPPAPASGSSYAGSDKFGTSSLDTKKYSGDITYYTLGLGSCGYDDTGVDLSKHIVALSHVDWYERGSGTSLGIDMPNHPWCDQTITITAGDKTTTALVHDICPSCASGSIDVSEAVFDALFGSLDGGREQASWSFN